MNQLDIERAVYELRELNLPENIVTQAEVALTSLLVFNSSLIPEIEFDIDESYNEIAIRFENEYHSLSICILNNRTIIICILKDSTNILYSKGYEPGEDYIDDLLDLFRKYMMENQNA